MAFTIVGEIQSYSGRRQLPSLRSAWTGETPLPTRVHDYFDRHFSMKSTRSFFILLCSALSMYTMCPEL